MDRDFLTDLFSEFGPVSLRRMFSGYGVSADGTNFALVLRGAIYFRADEQTAPRFQDEGSKPFQYDARGKSVTVGSYWQLPDRLYDDPEELAQWARAALAAAERAAATKRAKVPRTKAKPAKTKITETKITETKTTKVKTSQKQTKPAKKAAKPRAAKTPARKRAAVQKKR
jgi:DNA transformation protein and related proteins